MGSRKIGKTTWEVHWVDIGVWVTCECGKKCLGMFGEEGYTWECEKCGKEYTATVQLKIS